MSNTDNHLETMASNSPPNEDFDNDPPSRYLRNKLAKDMKEFDGTFYLNLDLHDQIVYALALNVLLDLSGLNANGHPFAHPRSAADRRSRARTTIRELKKVAQGVRPKFETQGYFIKPGQLRG